MDEFILQDKASQSTLEMKGERQWDQPQPVQYTVVDQKSIKVGRRSQRKILEITSVMHLGHFPPTINSMLANAGPS